MLINRTHISHFDVAINTKVVPCDRLVQLTGTWGNLLRFAAYLGLEKVPFSFDDECFLLIDDVGRPRGQLHRMAGGNQLVLHRDWFETETR
jgi:hypothetical protein